MCGPKLPANIQKYIEIYIHFFFSSFSVEKQKHRNRKCETHKDNESLEQSIQKVARKTDFQSTENVGCTSFFSLVRSGRKSPSNLDIYIHTNTQTHIQFHNRQTRMKKKNIAWFSPCCSSVAVEFTKNIFSAFFGFVSSTGHYWHRWCCCCCVLNIYVS